MCVTIHFDGGKWVPLWFPVWRHAPKKETSAHKRTERTHVMCACVHDVMCVCVYACAYVCTCVCVYAHMHVCMYVRTYVRSLMYMRTCMRACVHMLMCVCVCVYVHAWRMCVRAMCTCDVRACVRACLHARQKAKKFREIYRNVYPHAHFELVSFIVCSREIVYITPHPRICD
jgi:hypothetical protein